MKKSCSCTIKVQEADECDEWLDCYGAGILCGVSNKQAEEILESLVKKRIYRKDPRLLPYAGKLKEG